MTEESVKVVVRVRPQTEKELARKLPEFMDYDKKEKQITVRNLNPESKTSKIFSFDQIFLPESSQTEVFESTGRILVNEVLQGYNGTIFAYGQTGSGKTYTMMGNATKRQESLGIIPRCFGLILEQAKSNNNKDFLIMCSYIELYNEEIRDLLAQGPNGTKQKLDLRESPDKGIFIKDLMKIPVTTEEEMSRYLQIGNQNRVTGETLMNAESSRSHSIFTIYVQSLERKDDMEKLVGSKFNLVDLAGSERQGKTGSTGQRFLEATKINLSLTALGKVISALVEGKGSHIPYRDSKLTRLLQDSLGGNAKTLMIATISPSYYNYDEILGTLKYASRAKYITNAPKINQDPKDALLKEYEDEIKRLRGQLKGLQDNEKSADQRQLIQEKQQITKQAEQQKKELMMKIRQLKQQLISPSELSQKLLNERERREEKLSFMEKNYRSLEDEVKEMRELLTELRRKYKNASKEIFQLESEHQREKEKIQEEFVVLQKDNIVFRSVLSILFTEKQLNSIIGLGSWDNESSFKLPAFYFKDRYTLAFPCASSEEKTATTPDNISSNPKARDFGKFSTTSYIGFRSMSQQRAKHTKKKVIY